MWQGLGGLVGVIVGKLEAERAGRNRVEPARKSGRIQPSLRGHHTAKVATRLRGKGNRR